MSSFAAGGGPAVRASTAPQQNHDPSHQRGALERAIYLRTSKPLLNETGTIIGLSVAVLDIPARKQARDRPPRSEEDLRHTVELTPHIPWTGTPAGDLNFMSPRWSEITGMPVDPETPKHWALGIHADDRARTLHCWNRFIDREVDFDCECRVRCVGGAWRWHRTRAYPRRNADGKVIRWYGTIGDIHDRKLAEAALLEAKEALDKLAHEDHLTELANRRTFDERLLKEIDRAQTPGFSP